MGPGVAKVIVCSTASFNQGETSKKMLVRVSIRIGVVVFGLSGSPCFFIRSLAGTDDGMVVFRLRKEGVEIANQIDQAILQDLHSADTQSISVEFGVTWITKWDGEVVAPLLRKPGIADSRKPFDRMVRVHSRSSTSRAGTTSDEVKVGFTFDGLWF